MTQEEMKLVDTALKSVEAARTAVDVQPILKKIEELDRPGLRHEVFGILSDAKGVVQSFALRTPAERQTPLFRQQFERLKERAAEVD